MAQLITPPIDDPVWVATVFTKNRDRLLSTDMSRKVMAAILAHPEVKPLLSDDHFPVDGTLIKALGFDEELPAESTARDRRTGWSTSTANR